MRHELYNADTSKRIQRSHQNLFDQGGMCQHLIYGYRKEPGSKTDDAMSKDPGAEPIYREWFDKLKGGASFAEVADWLNEQGVPVGPLCRGSKWDGTMVGRVTRNPLLKGLRERNRKMSRRVNKSGKYRAVAAPPEMLRTRECPHLAFLEPDLFDEVNELLKVRNENHRRAKEGISDPRKGVPKKRTQWPAQQVCCGVCGRIMTCQGKKDRRTLVCSGAASYRCWNSVSLNLNIAGEKLVGAIAAAIGQLPGYDAALAATVERQTEQVLSTRNQRHRQLGGEITDAKRQLDNLTEALAQSGGSAVLREKLADCKPVRSNYSAEFVVNLIDPPQPERYRQLIWELSQGENYLKEREIATQVGVTQPVVQRAKKLHRRMIKAGLTDGYVPVKEVPAGRSRLRRHKHKRYRFEPLVDFPKDWPS